MRLRMIAAVVLGVGGAALGQGESALMPKPGPTPLPAMADLGVWEVPAMPGPDRSVNQPTNEALEKPLTKVLTEKMPLEQVLELVAREGHLPISVKWNELGAAGVRRDAPVSVDLAEVPAKKVLATVLAEAGRANATLIYLVDNNRVVISTKEDFRSRKYLVVAVYDFRKAFADMELSGAQAAAEAQAIIETLQQAVEPDSWRNAGGLVGAAKFINGQLIVETSVDLQEEVGRVVKLISGEGLSNTRSYDVRDLVKRDAKRDAEGGEKVKSLMHVIEESCGRATWREHGGKSSSMEYFDGRLYVTTRREVHDQIRELLAVMRK